MALQRVKSNMLAAGVVLNDNQGLTVGADNNLYIDTANNRVGINTNSPTHTLTVNGTVSATVFVGDGSQLTGVGASDLDAVTDLGSTTTNSITVGGLAVTGTTAVKLPAGTTLERPSGTAGHIRFNNQLVKFEGYDGSAWGSLGGGAAYASTAPANPQTGHR